MRETLDERFGVIIVMRPARVTPPRPPTGTRLADAGAEPESQMRPVGLGLETRKAKAGMARAGPLPMGAPRDPWGGAGPQLAAVLSVALALQRGYSARTASMSRCPLRTRTTESGRVLGA